MLTAECHRHRKSGTALPHRLIQRTRTGCRVGGRMRADNKSAPADSKRRGSNFRTKRDSCNRCIDSRKLRGNTAFPPARIRPTTYRPGFRPEPMSAVPCQRSLFQQQPAVNSRCGVSCLLLKSIGSREAARGIVTLHRLLYRRSLRDVKQDECARILATS